MSSEAGATMEAVFRTMSASLKEIESRSTTHP